MLKNSAFETYLEGLVPPTKGAAASVSEAMRYALLSGGKRFRPFLVFSTGALFSVSQKTLMPVAAAIEMMHCYSLIHDDLPCMDDDDWRRGQASTHKAFGEAVAILAGDALQALAFETLTQTNVDAEVKLALVQSLAQVAGQGQGQDQGRGMIAGQAMDMYFTGGAIPETSDDIYRLYDLKTGALIGWSMNAAAQIGGATIDEQQALQDYARHLGRAFQIADDLLDTQAGTGKSAGKDKAQGKPSLVVLYGAARANEFLDREKHAALAALSGFDERADTLREILEFVVTRKS